MTNMNTADQPVNDAQEPAAEPMTIKSEGPFGTVTWTPSEHAQGHLQALTGDKLERYLEVASDQLGEQAAILASALCVDKNPLLLLIADMFGLEQTNPFDLSSGFTSMPSSVFDDIVNGRAPRL